MTTHKRLFVLVLGAMAGMVMAASAAFACANLVTINLSDDAAAAGSTVTFRVDATRDSGDRPTSDVEVRWNGHDGQLLASGPSVNRTFQGEITIPNVPPGQYMVLANQFYTDTGDPVPGAPARAAIEVTAAQASGAAVSSTQAPAAEAEAAPASGGAAAATEESAPASQPAATEASAAQSSSAPQEFTAAQPAPTQGTESGGLASENGAAAAATPPQSQTTAAAAAESTGADAAATQLQSTAPSPVAAAETAWSRFAAAERAAAAQQSPATTVPQVSNERAAALQASPVVATAPLSATSAALPVTTAAAGWALLALALAMAAAMTTNRRRRRHGLGLAVGRLPLS